MMGKEFASLRLKKGFLSRSSLAEAMGRAYWAVMRWENGTRPVPEYAVKFLKNRKSVKKPQEHRIEVLDV